MKRTLMAAGVAACLLGFATASYAGEEHAKTEVASYRIPAYATHTFTMWFGAGQDVEVYVQGDGDTDLDVFIYDENGVLIVADTDITDLCLVAWTPLWTGPFDIVVVNRGFVYNDYVIKIMVD